MLPDDKSESDYAGKERRIDMAFDGIAVRCVTAELNKLLLGGRVDKIYMPDRDEIIICFRSLGKNRKLLLSCNPSLPRVHFIERSRENPAAPPSFCMLLRKQLSGGKLISVNQPNMERIIEFGVESKNELGDTVVRYLIIEIMGRHSNIILTDETRKITECVRRVDASISRARLVLPGMKYEYPPEQNKILPKNITFEKVKQVIFDCPNDKKLDKHILDNFAGFSPMMSREPVFEACGDVSPVYMQISATQAENTARKVFDVLTRLNERNFSPCIIYDEEGKPKDFSAIDISMYEKCIAAETLSENLDDFYYEREFHTKLMRKGADMIKTVANLIERYRRKAVLQQEAIAESEKKDEYKLYADIITANIYKIKKGDKRLITENYYDGTEIDISLDVHLSPAENAQKYYSMYNKLKNTAEKAKISLENSLKDIEYLESIQTATENSESLSDLSEIKSELYDEGYIKRPKSSKKGKEKQSMPIKFISSDGFEIFVGKNNRQNDYLTLKMSKKNDIWFHTKTIPGSHTVISTENREVPETTLREAAMLAAYHSKARNSQNVPVDYTIIKNVKKPSGAKPGMVIYVDYNTVYITPDEAQIGKMKK